MAICKACHRSNVRANYQRNRGISGNTGAAGPTCRTGSSEGSLRADASGARGPSQKQQGVGQSKLYQEARADCLRKRNRDGRLIRQPCEVCGEVKSQAHHGDYGKPLDVSVARNTMRNGTGTTRRRCLNNTRLAAGRLWLFHVRNV